MVGSIRVELEGDKATLGRLAVVPDLQGLGIGTQMLLAVLTYLPEQTQEVWVFTGQDSKQNLSMYAKQGFEHAFDQHTGDLTYAYLKKILGEGGEDEAGEGDVPDGEGDDSGQPAS